MAQGELTKQEAEEIQKAVQEMWEAPTKTKRMDFRGGNMKGRKGSKHHVKKHKKSKRVVGRPKKNPVNTPG